MKTQNKLKIVLNLILEKKTLEVLANSQFKVNKYIFRIVTIGIKTKNTKEILFLSCTFLKMSF